MTLCPTLKRQFQVFLHQFGQGHPLGQGVCQLCEHTNGHISIGLHLFKRFLTCEQRIDLRIQIFSFSDLRFEMLNLVFKNCNIAFLYGYCRNQPCIHSQDGDAPQNHGQHDGSVELLLLKLAQCSAVG